MATFPRSGTVFQIALDPDPALGDRMVNEGCRMLRQQKWMMPWHDKGQKKGV